MSIETGLIEPPGVRGSGGDGRVGLSRSLGALQAFTLSIAVIGPTIAMAFNVSLATQFAGSATPLAFLLGSVTTFLVGLSFVAFARRIASAGSVIDYVTDTFGRSSGFLAGWALLLTYMAFLAATSTLTGRFANAALSHVGAGQKSWWCVAFATGCLAMAVAGREMRRLSYVLLTIEVCAIVAILVLVIIIMAQVSWSAEPFHPDPAKGLSGVGYGVAFAVLSFAGFEGATTVGAETRAPHRSIPWAVLGSITSVGLFYVVASYAQVLGFGMEHMDALRRSDAPLDALAQRYLWSGFGAVLDGAAAISALGAALGAAAAGGRVLFTMGRSGMLGGSWVGTIDERHGSPRRAVWVVAGTNLAGLTFVGVWANSKFYAEATSTVGALAIVLVYMLTGVAQATFAWRNGQKLWMSLGLSGAAVLCWPMFTSIYPIPPWPGIIWPAFVALWMVVGVLYIGRTRSRELSGEGASSDRTNSAPDQRPEECPPDQISAI